MEIYHIHNPIAAPLPILLSVPHCGTYFPEDIKNEIKDELLPPDDTDWFVQQLYDFAPTMGITLISATHSRWVIDLNRNPQSIPLYNDGRVITGLCTSTDFLGNPIYKDERKEVNTEETERRLAQYFTPYHQKLQETLDDLKAKFGKVLLWDCHSIRKVVPSIYDKKFPDLILGDADGTSASTELINLTLNCLSESEYTVNHNHPFKGGYITRSFGKPDQQQHALQLEMTKTNYMDDLELAYHEERAAKMQTLLKKTLQELANKLLS